MKKSILFGLTALLLACGGNDENTTASDEGAHSTSIPIPTQVFENMGDEEAYEERRDAYFDLIHSSSADVDWRAINAANFEAKAEERALLRQSRIVEIFAEGALEAEWRERGSNDVPGNVRICDYHPSTEDVYVISDGGILWKGNLDGETWTPLNDHLQLGRRVMKVVDLPGGGLRIIAAIGYGLMYSDDEGETWTDAEGLGGSNGSGINLVQLNDAEKTIVYLYNTVNVVSGVSRNKVAYSTDNGENFTVIADLAYGGSRFASMDMAYGSSAAYVLDNNDDVYKFEGGTFTEIVSGLSLDGTSRCMIQANEAGGDLTLYVLMDNNKLFKSTDDGLSFDFVSNLPSSSWDVGFEVSEDDPNKLYYGEVNLFRSFDGGESFELVSEWWEYYGDVANKIHADIMSIEPFKKEDGTEFTLIPNHGGINISYDNLLTTPNIAMSDLNTGQFYDVLTAPHDAGIIYGGTQDQGFQRTLGGDSPDPSNFEQVISGDYGEMQFTNNAQTVWAQYPGGWFIVYADAETDGGYSYEFDVSGSDMPNYNWIVPTGAAPYPEDNFIYVGGGNLSGGSGSRLIKLTLSGGTINSSQYDFDFKDASGASISAIETTSLQDEFIYVVTENGRFFHSEDEGDSFTMTDSYIGPSGGWIYTADIYASRLTPGLVFVGGSGYAGSSVYMSVDSAKSFIALEGDMPNTMVHEMAMDPQEKFLFAATDAGPYVYSMETEEWYDIAGVTAPLQQYISVEFIPSEYIVRFATWGRGIWDFDITTMTGIEEEHFAKINVFPNPSSDGLIGVNLTEKSDVFIFDLNGRQVYAEPLNEGYNAIDLSSLSNGTYVVVGRNESGEKISEKLVISK